MGFFTNEYGDLKTGNIFLTAAVVIGVPVLALIFKPFTIVQPGERVVVTRLGKVQPGSLGEGIHGIVPLLDKTTKFDTRIQKNLVTASGFSSDNQEVNITVSVNWQVTAAEVPTLFQELKTLDNATDRILVPAVNEEVKAAIANYDAESTIKNRPTIKQSIVEGVTRRLEARNLTVLAGGVNIDNIDFSHEFEAAVEAKVVAAQQAQAAVNIAKGEAEAAEQQAARDVALAKGKAESAKLEAEALKAQGGNLVLQKEALSKWDGKLPQTLITGGKGGDIPNLILNAK